MRIIDHFISKPTFYLRQLALRSDGPGPHARMIGSDPARMNLAAFSFLSASLFTSHAWKLRAGSAESMTAWTLFKYLLLPLKEGSVSFILHCFNGLSFLSICCFWSCCSSLFPVSSCLSDAHFWHFNWSFSLLQIYWSYLAVPFFVLWMRSRIDSCGQYQLFIKSVSEVCLVEIYENEKRSASVLTSVESTHFFFFLSTKTSQNDKRLP